MKTREFHRSFTCPDADLGVFANPLHKHIHVQVSDRHFQTTALASLTREQAEELRRALSEALYYSAAGQEVPHATR